LFIALRAGWKAPGLLHPHLKKYLYGVHFRCVGQNKNIFLATNYSLIKLSLSFVD